MKKFLIAAIAAAGLVGVANTAEAKGCLKGAAVGGVAGHVAGHHGVLGAAAGCAVGHHEAKVKDRKASEAARAPQPDPAQPTPAPK
ncbi:MAG: hypothetical protein M3O01_09385 [Pseudomonadota bacterium]|nr:hypothetical protein [Pseudomonadota bacterium]